MLALRAARAAAAAGDTDGACAALGLADAEGEGSDGKLDGDTNDGSGFLKNDWQAHAWQPTPLVGAEAVARSRQLSALLAYARVQQVRLRLFTAPAADNQHTDVGSASPARNSDNRDSETEALGAAIAGGPGSDGKGDARPGSDGTLGAGTENGEGGAPGQQPDSSVPPASSPKLGGKPGSSKTPGESLKDALGECNSQLLGLWRAALLKAAMVELPLRVPLADAGVGAASAATTA
ncbi:hypothetical protein T492DRAFT_867834 [Pavlovales sp. CCMP2436]|nr:hypothetical protein T492DRAFT_867834 [Pavlovales sp. CCMP2436]